MNRTIYALIGLFFAGLLLTASIYSEEKKPNPVKPIQKTYQPGIMLTFDDNYVDDWYNAEKRLQHSGWKATFFICKYDSLTPQQKKKLHYLQDMGHDIAAHGYNHENALKYSAKYGLTKYVNDEVIPLKAAMDKDGFNIRSFAYPDGARDATLDKELLKYFDIIRGTTYGKLPPESQYCYYEGKRVIYGLGIDDDYKQFDVAYYKTLMKYAKKHNKILVFYGHKTVTNADERLETPLSALQEICEYATNNGLKFYTVDDLKNL
jgi:peptidoglycan/xylan/chitin deacetylase (PgdA/CDA1 family)